MQAAPASPACNALRSNAGVGYAKRCGRVFCGYSLFSLRLCVRFFLLITFEHEHEHEHEYEYDRIDRGELRLAGECGCNPMGGMVAMEYAGRRPGAAGRLKHDSRRPRVRAVSAAEDSCGEPDLTGNGLAAVPPALKR